ncbi:hypothetical protein DUNSADRAFT_10341 [Dunaliella salina]|uniref:NECAP PHear domain-containing protein n=1 Tax=Dunaliella salina TaxID=3046 RepID=A0ABQ7H4W6_DUNSA|nr:hypothetical protein DUNSADRAFT_10341 [Dunaliella salina]|eukprot:KAF5841904.1 hypothetical protein DUNSADRAFT_10341 [Dunaliella salina]
MDDDEPIPQILCTIGEVNCYGIPPLRPGTIGHRSAEWLVGSRIFTGKLKVVSIGLRMEIQLEEPASGQLFAACPIAHGMRSVCVESCVDSSRNFVIRLEDPGTKRHAFVGLGFTTREESSEFTEAMLRHEKYAEREIAASKVGAVGHQQQQQQQQQQGGKVAAAVAVPSSSSLVQKTANQEMEALYAPRQERALGSQTIHLKLPSATKKTETPGGAPTSGSGRLLGTAGTSPQGLIKLAPPPPPAHLAPPPTPPAQVNALPLDPPAPFVQSSPGTDVFDPFAELSSAGADPFAMPHASNFPSGPTAQPQPPQAQPHPTPASQDSGWATFL